MSQINLQLALLIDHELRGREQNASALASVLFVYVDLSASQVESL
ncbi:MAG: hypothetical protein WA211_05495 [Candidatus Acidiferrales bacterium]